MSLAGLRGQLKAAREKLNELRAEEARRREESKAVRATGGTLRLYDFVKAAWHILEPDNPFQDNWHIGAICEHLEAVTALEFRNLIINIPPRHAKSLLVSVFWFAWVWTLNPYSRWVFSSYGENLAHRDAVKCRDVVTSGWYQSRWGDTFKLRGDQYAKEKIQNDKQGFRIATTVAGRALGEGGSYFVVDDPLKVEDAESPNARQKVIDWWTGTVATRSTGDPRTFRRVVVMQRLHEHDLSGYLVAEVGGYEHLVIPVEYEPRRYWLPDSGKPKPKDAIIPTKVQRRSVTARDPRTEEGELLWAKQFDRATVDALKKELRHRAAGQLQQRPSDPEGAVFRRSTFRSFAVEQRSDGLYFVLQLPEDRTVAIPVASCRLFQCADTAVKIKKRNDYTAVCTAFLAPGGYLLIFDVCQYKIESPHLMKFIRSCKHGPTRWDQVNLTPVRVGRWPGGKPVATGRQFIEDAASGSGIIQTAALNATPVRGMSSAGDKVEKAIPLATLYENGNVFHLAGAAWRNDFEEELVAFPNTAHDDRTDAAGMCGRVATEDRVLRMGMAGLEEVAEEYPEFAAWKEEEKENTERAARDAEYKRQRAEILAATGMDDPEKPKKKPDDEASDESPEPKKYKIRVSGGDLELPND